MEGPSTSTDPGISLRAQYARRILEDYVKRETHHRLRADHPHRSRPWNVFKLPPFTIPPARHDKDALEDVPPGKVCIIGAGMAGLVIAYILKNLFPKVKFDIFEAHAKRVGGRVYTHKFE